MNTRKKGRLRSFIFSHLITPLGVRMLASGIRAPRSCDVEIKTGGTVPALMDHIMGDEPWEFLFIPLQITKDGKREDAVAVTGGSVSFSPALAGELPYDFESLALELPKYFSFVSDNGNLVIQTKGYLPANMGRISDSAKVAKRAKEWFRLVNSGIAGMPKLLELGDYAHEDTDGRAAVSVSWVCRAIISGSATRDQMALRRDLRDVRNGKVTTILLRIMGPKGLLKVEANIVPDDTIPYGRNVVFHGDEWKKELMFNDWFSHLELKRHTTSPVLLDLQTASWMQEWMFPLPLMREVVGAYFDKARDAVRAGEFPEYMLRELDVDPDGFYEPAGTRDLQSMSENYVKWQLNGMKLNQSANFVFMAYNSIINKAKARDIFAPVPWAVRAHVCTQRFMTDVCGYEIPVEYANVVYFDERVNCLVYPTELFLALSANHGGWDQDGDSVVIALRMVAGEERFVGVVWRSPNSTGEYAIVEVAEDTIPWEFTDLVDIPEVDLSKRPQFIDEVRAEQNLITLPVAPKSDDAWSYVMTLRELATQLANPHIGRIANALLVYASLTGGKVPTDMPPLEDMVDTCMQARYLPAFEIINAWIASVHEAIREIGRIDRFLAGDVVHDFYGKAVPWDEDRFKPIAPRLPDTVLNGMARYDGYFTKLWMFVMDELLAFREDLKNESFRVRARNPIRQLTGSGFFVAEDAPLASRGVNMVKWAEEEFSAIMRRYPVNDDRFYPIHKRLRSEANRDVVRRAVVSLNKLTLAERAIVLTAAYRFCIRRGEKQHTFGWSDRILYAYGPEGEQSVLDLWIEVLNHLGVADNSAIIAGLLTEELNKLLS